MINLETFRFDGSPRRAFIVVALVLASSVMLALQTVAVAQNGEFPLPVSKFNCGEDPGTIPQAVLPEGCVMVEGVAITIFDTGGTELGSCVTNADGTCTVNVVVPDDSTVVIEEDESTGTPGYSPRENPIEVVIQNEFSEGKIVNIRDVEDLPTTGASVLMETTSSAGPPIQATMLVGFALLFAVGGMLIRRSHMH